VPSDDAQDALLKLRLFETAPVETMCGMAVEPQIGR
jgi:hypothetical protein